MGPHSRECSIAVGVVTAVSGVSGVEAGLAIGDGAPELDGVTDAGVLERQSEAARGFHVVL
jgi:hypothetical protein